MERDSIFAIFCMLFLGLYIPADCKEVYEEFRGIGIRIEDDITLTNDAVEVLTKKCNKNYKTKS